MNDGLANILIASVVLYFISYPLIKPITTLVTFIADDKLTV